MYKYILQNIIKAGRMLTGLSLHFTCKEELTKRTRIVFFGLALPLYHCIIFAILLYNCIVLLYHYTT